MKCEYCSWSAKPDLLPSVTAHIESSHKDLYPIVVWRKGEFVVTKKKKKNEAEFDVNVVHLDPAPFPEVFTSSGEIVSSEET
jgi:hypothetical protein